MLAALHSHTEYSLLDGAGTSVQHAIAAREAGYGALAITDHGTLAGSIHHMRACREAGIMPIVGCEVYFRPNRKVQGQKEWLKVYYHLTLHAKDQRGWRNLMLLVSEAHRSGFYGKACVDLELLEKYSEGLICYTGCLGGLLCKSIINEDDRGAENWLRQLKRIFRDDLFIEIMPHAIPEQVVANGSLIVIGQQHSIPLVATIDSHYPTVEYATTQDVLLMISTNQTVKKREKKRDEGEDVYEFTVKTLYHQTEQELKTMFALNNPGISAQVVDESIRNTLVAASRTTPFLVDKTEKMPSVSFPNVPDNRSYLCRLFYEGLDRRGYGADDHYRKLGEFELDTFDEHEVVDYLLLVWDIVDWARSTRSVPKRVKGQLVYDGTTKRPIMVGPGRGSAAGSIVCWAIGITNVNPVKYKLLFERFLNPNRRGLPDIDIDFPPDRVDEVEDYIKAKHGPSCVVDIIAHSTFGPRAALTDVGRVLSIPYEHVKAATKTIDDQDRSSLESIRVVNSAVAKLAEDHPQMWEEAKRIQGMVARKCVTGDTMIQSARPGSEPRMIVEIMSRKPSLRWTKIKGMVEDGLLGWVDVTAFHDAGVMSVWKLRAGEYEIRASAEHRFLTKDGWKTLADLQVGELVATNGKCLPGCQCGRHFAKHVRNPNPKKCEPGCTCKRHNACNSGQMKSGSVPWNKGLVGVQEAWNKGLSVETSDGVRKQAEKMIGNSNGSGRAGKVYAPESVNTFRKRVLARDGFVCGRCKKPDVPHRMHAHHIVPRRLGGTHETSNGIMICAACHPTEDGHRGITGDATYWNMRQEIQWSAVDEVSYAGEEQCYDITISKHHNYVANGFVTHNSEHAGGVLILPGPVADYIPVERTGGQKGKLLSAFGERSGKGNALISELNLVKVDVLRVAELTKQQHACDLYEQRTGKSIDLDALDIHDDPYKADPKVMQGFKDGLLVGVFQFSATASKLTRQIKPDNVLELAAINALIRPGPRGAGSDQRFHRRKHGGEPVALMKSSLPLGALEPFLDYTFGELVFQEQLIEVVHHLGGLTRAQADIFRKIASKLYRDPEYAREVMGEWELPIKEGFRANGLDLATIDLIWPNLLSFSDYSFNLCVSGDTIVERAGTGRYCSDPKISVKEIWEIQEGPRTPMRNKLRGRGIKILQMDDDGRIRPGKLKRVIHNGSRSLLMIKTVGGRSLKVTSNHRLLTDRGYVEAGSMVDGDSLVVQGTREAYGDQYLTGRTRGHARGGSYEGEGFPSGVNNPSWIDGRRNLLNENQTKVRERAGCDRCKKQKLVDSTNHDFEVAHNLTLEQCGGIYVIFHSFENLSLLCNSCHKKFDYEKAERKKRWSRGLPTDLDLIDSIEVVGVEDVFDIEMETAGHNFLANEVVSHNSHASGYAVLAYRDMWLKTYVPREFYAAFLSKGLSQITKKRVLQKQEAAREMRSLPTYIASHPLKIMPPDVNESGADYTVVDGGIRLGLEAIKNVGPSTSASIIRQRPYQSYQDFDARVARGAVNITSRASMVMAGAFDRWRMRDDYTEARIDELERELLGMSLTSTYSIQQYAQAIEGKFWTEDEVDAAPDGTYVAVMGEVTAVKEHVDKKGHTMAFVDLAYGANQWSCTVFSYLYTEFYDLLHSRRPILITGSKNTFNDRVSIKVESLPPDSDGESTPPIFDLEDYVSMLGDQEESLAEDSVYPEDHVSMLIDQEELLIGDVNVTARSVEAGT